MVDQAQDTLRPNNRFQICRQQWNKPRPLKTVCLSAECWQNRAKLSDHRRRAFDRAVNLLVLQVFRKDDYAVKYA